MTSGQTAFEAYNKSRGGVNHLGNKTPDWVDLPEEIQRAWEAAAFAVGDHVHIINTFVRVYLDGKLQRYVRAFDTEEGWVDAYDPAAKKDIRLTGVVTITYEEHR